MQNILTDIKEIINSGKKSALCIVVDTKGSTPGKTGAKMIVFEDGSIEGTIGGGTLEMQVIKDALETIKESKPVKLVYDLDKDMDMNCGGFTEVYIEPVAPDLKLYIFGVGHIGKALAEFAPGFDFSVTLFDNRELTFENKKGWNLEYIGQDYIESIKQVKFDENTFVVIVTPKHSYDEEILSVCAKKEFAYLGMIGSKTKIAKARKRLIESNVLTEEEINKVDMPIGIRFKAITPDEIALSILAKMIDVKNTVAER
jgi:xanthine dehydrogenase accessory factor